MYKRQEYTYAHQLSTTIPTMTSVTKIKQMKMQANNNGNTDIIEEKENTHAMNKEKDMENEMEMEEQNENQITFNKPNFLRVDKEQEITPAQKGTLVHMCMQRLDETKEYTLEMIQDLINDLVKREIITEKEAKSIHPYKVLEFTKSMIWKDLKTAKKVYKLSLIHI